MDNFRIALNVPVQPVTANQASRALLTIDSGDRALGSVLITIRFLPQFFTNINFRGIGFEPPQGSGVFGRLSTEGLLTICASKLDNPTGNIQIAEIEFTVIGPPGTSAPIEVQVLEAIRTNGTRIPFASKVFQIAIEPNPLTLLDDNIPSGRLNQLYHSVLSIQGGTPPFTCSLASGSLPPGMQISPAGVLTGTPTQTGTYNSALTILDSGQQPQTIQSPITIEIKSEKLAIVTRRLPPLCPGRAYSTTLQSSGGLEPITLSIDNLPAGLSLQGNTISGVLDEAPVDFQPVDIKINIQDSEQPAQTATRTLELEFRILEPFAEYEIQSPTAVAVGRDLLLVDYQLEIAMSISEPNTDPDFEREVKDTEAAIMDELTNALFCQEVQSPGPMPGPTPDQPGLDSGNVSDPEFQPGSSIVVSRCLNVDFPAPNAENRPPTRYDERVLALMAWFREINSWLKDGGIPVSYTLCVFIDGDIAGCKSTGSLKLFNINSQNNTAIQPIELSTPLRIAWAWLPLVQPIARFMIRQKIISAVNKKQTLISEKKDYIVPSKAEKNSTNKNKPASFEISFDQFNGLRHALQDTKKYRGRNLKPLITASVIGLGLLAAFAGGIFPLILFIGFFAGLTAVLSAGIIFQINNWISRANSILDSILEPTVITPESNEPGTMQLTPGAHRMTVTWSKAGGGSSSPYIAARQLATTLSFEATFTPKNPENWARLDGDTSITRGGLNFSGHENIDISLYGSDLDLISARNDGKLFILPGKGDSSFAEPRLFSNQGGGANLQLLVRTIDDIGRSSIVTLDGNLLLFHFNKGMRGFSQSQFQLSLNPGEKISSLDIADLDGDGWMEIILGMADSPGILRNMHEFYNSPDEALELTRFSEMSMSPILHDPVSSILARKELITGTPSAYHAHLAFTYRVSGQIYLTENQGDGTFSLPTPLPEFSGVNNDAYPIDLTLEETGAGDCFLCVALLQERKISVLKKGDDQWSLMRSELLPFRPRQIAIGPSYRSGIAICAENGVAAYLLYDPVIGSPGIYPLHQGHGPLQLDGKYGLLLVSCKAENKLLVYR